MDQGTIKKPESSPNTERERDGKWEMGNGGHSGARRDGPLLPQAHYKLCSVQSTAAL